MEKYQLRCFLMVMVFMVTLNVGWCQQRQQQHVGDMVSGLVDCFNFIFGNLPIRVDDDRQKLCECLEDSMELVGSLFASGFDISTEDCRVRLNVTMPDRNRTTLSVALQMIPT